MKLSEETRRQCVFAITGVKCRGCYQFTKSFYGLADIPTIFRANIDRIHEYCTPAWPGDIMVVTRGNEQDRPRKKLLNVLNKLENVGYRTSKFLHEKKTKWL